MAQAAIFNRDSTGTVLKAWCVLCVLTIALLNPLLCVLHCAAGGPAQHTLDAQAAPSFLCLQHRGGVQGALVASETSAAPLSMPMPRAVYESVAAAPAAQLPLLGTLLLLAVLPLACSQSVTAPQTPPPRLFL